MLLVRSTTPGGAAATHSALRGHPAPILSAIASVLVLLGVPAARSDSASEVNLPNPQITLSPRSQVLEACHGKSRFGCTVFAPVEFRCACSSDGERWWIATHVSATARVYVSHPSYIQHELQHVFDVRSRLRVFAAVVAARQYASDAACDQGAEEAKESFTSVVAEVVRITRQARDSRALPPRP